MNSFIDNHQTFLTELAVRTGQVRDDIQSNFALTAQVDVTLDVFPVGAGKIKISTIIPTTLPWTGVYFNGNPVQFTAIPNIGYEGLDTQEILFPNLTVPMGDLLSAKKLAKRLVDDEEFYQEQSRAASTNYKNIYTEEDFKIKFYDKFN
jgi:hypothetical protein